MRLKGKPKTNPIQNTLFKKGLLVKRLPFSIFLPVHIPIRNIPRALKMLIFGATEYFHTLEIQPKPSDYILTIVDEDGQHLQQKFKVSYTK
jgi:hypothetical protein